MDVTPLSGRVVHRKYAGMPAATSSARPLEGSKSIANSIGLLRVLMEELDVSLMFVVSVVQNAVYFS
jgi:hypothetical protein